MGLPNAVAEYLFFENSYRKIEGDVAFVGAQTTWMDEPTLRRLAAAYGRPLADDFRIQYDTLTRGAQEKAKEGRRYISDDTLMRALGCTQLRKIDVSDYEGADIIADLSYPIDPRYHGTLDFLFDGGCLDNIFNPAQALMNMSKLLRPGGRMLLLNMGSFFANPYSVCCPGWYFDFFCANAYADCKVYLCLFDNVETLFHRPWSTHLHNPLLNDSGVTPPPTPNYSMVIMVLAEKAAGSTDDRQPQQRQYRDEAYHSGEYARNRARILTSDRPAFGWPTAPGWKENVMQIYATGGTALHCASLGANARQEDDQSQSAS